MARRIFFRISLIIPFFLVAYYITFYVFLSGSHHFQHILLFSICVFVLGALYIIPRVALGRRDVQLIVQASSIVTFSFLLNLFIWKVLYLRPVSILYVLRYSVMVIAGLLILCIFSSLTSWTRRGSMAIVLLIGVSILKFAMFWSFRGFRVTNFYLGLSFSESVIPIALIASLILGDFLDFKGCERKG